MINSLHINYDDKFLSLVQKLKRNNRDKDSHIKNYISGGFDKKRKVFNANNVNYKYININGVAILNTFKINVGVNKKFKKKGIRGPILVLIIFIILGD